MTYRRKANLILLGSFICFILAFLWWATHDLSLPEQLLLFVIQSALIGSIADWFAVTALFEKPLGFPYHTELLYSNREQIIDSITKIISKQLLQPKIWQDKLRNISFIDKLSVWLREPAGKEKFRNLLYAVSIRAYGFAQKGDTQQAILIRLRSYLKKQPLVNFFQDRLISLLADPNSNMFTDTLNLIRELIASDEFDTVIKDLILQWQEESKHSTVSTLTINKVLGIVDPQKIAQDIKSGLLIWLDHWEQADAAQKEWLCRKFELFLYSMSGQLAFAVQNWQDQFIDSLPLEQWLDATQGAVEIYFTSGQTGQEELKDMLETQFFRYIAYCRSHESVKNWLDEQICRTCNILLEHEHSLIAIAVRDVLSTFDKRKFNEFLENKLGEDLSWIRINGAIVGASIGFCVFSFLYFLYQPLVVPLIRNWAFT